MKAVTLLYHDAVTGNHCDESGFSGPGASRYKLDVDDMEHQFEAISASRKDGPSNIYGFLINPNQVSSPLFLTFDDGGSSAVTEIAPLLEKYGWRGLFFITAGNVDTRAFVNSRQIQELNERGHVIGSHSWSHPERMPECSWDSLQNEWSKSIAKLSEITGAPVRVASVPNGYFSIKVAAAASACGVRALFTSEPIKRAYYVSDCLVLGRFTILKGMPPKVASALASDDISLDQVRQYLLWSGKKLTKFIGGKHYLAIRKRIIGCRNQSL